MRPSFYVALSSLVIALAPACSASADRRDALAVPTTGAAAAGHHNYPFDEPLDRQDHPDGFGGGPPPPGTVGRDGTERFALMIDPESILSAEEMDHFVVLGLAACDQARTEGSGAALAARWEADSVAAAADDLAGLDFVLTIGMSLPAARTLCPNDGHVIDEALLLLGVPADVIEASSA